MAKEARERAANSGAETRELDRILASITRIANTGGRGMWLEMYDVTPWIKAELKARGFKLSWFSDSVDW